MTSRRKYPSAQGMVNTSFPANLLSAPASQAMECRAILGHQRVGHLLTYLNMVYDKQRTDRRWNACWQKPGVAKYEQKSGPGTRPTDKATNTRKCDHALRIRSPRKMQVAKGRAKVRNSLRSWPWRHKTIFAQTFDSTHPRLSGACLPGNAQSLIPACAGHTGAYPGLGSIATSHPRLRGAHSEAVWLYEKARLSSPLARGTQRGGVALREGAPLIPACAGHTKRTRL